MKMKRESFPIKKAFPPFLKRFFNKFSKDYRNFKENYWKIQYCFKISVFDLLENWSN